MSNSKKGFLQAAADFAERMSSPDAAVNKEKPRVSSSPAESAENGGSISFKDVLQKEKAALSSAYTTLRSKNTAAKKAAKANTDAAQEQQKDEPEVRRTARPKSSTRPVKSIQQKKSYSAGDIESTVWAVSIGLGIAGTALSVLIAMVL